MNNTEEYKDRLLLEYVQKALKKWKWAEVNCRSYSDTCMLKNRNRIRAEALKGIYISLILEARKRELALTTKQLLDCILYPSPGGE